MTAENQDAEPNRALVARARGDTAAIRDVTALAKPAGGATSTLNDLFRRQAHSTPAAFLPEEMAA